MDGKDVDFGNEWCKRTHGTLASLPLPPLLLISRTCTLPRRNNLPLLTVVIQLRKLRNNINVHKFFFWQIWLDGIVGPVESAANQAFRCCTFPEDVFLRKTVVSQGCV